MNTFINNQRLAQLAGVNFDSEIIVPGKIVYSRTHIIKKQFKKLAGFPECILITSFSDASCTDELVDELPSNVRIWYSNNVETKNPRVVGVPIGLVYSIEMENKLRKAIEKGRCIQKNLMYMNFCRNIPRRINPRAGLFEKFEKKSWVTAEEQVYPEHFYDQMLSHKFILSPPGAGPDCHRHWEAMHLGAIPIVKRCPVTRILDDMPCLQIDSWDEVTEERLIKELPILRERFKNPVMEYCWFEFWKERILKS